MYRIISPMSNDKKVHPVIFPYHRVLLHNLCNADKKIKIYFIRKMHLLFPSQEKNSTGPTITIPNPNHHRPQVRFAAILLAAFALAPHSACS